MTRIILRHLEITPSFANLRPETKEKAGNAKGALRLASDAESLACSAVAFYIGIYPAESPYFFWGAGIPLPWARDTARNFRPKPFDELAFRRIVVELRRIGTCDSDGWPSNAVTYQSHVLGSTRKTTIQGLAVETILALDEYLEHLLRGKAVIAIPWLSAAYANLIEAACQCWELFGNGDERSRAGGIERHRRDPKQAEKNFVLACYHRWRANPLRYKSKAAFARDMLSKCTHLKSQKTIEDWVREWDSEGTSGALQAK